MGTPAVRTWLKRQARAEIVGNASMALVMGFAAVVALVITWAGLWFAGTFVLPWGYDVYHGFRGLPSKPPTAAAFAAFPAVMLCVLFVVEYALRRDRTANPWREFQQMASPDFDFIPAVARLLGGVVLVGPRLTSASLQFLHTIAAWQRLDVGLCAQVLDLLLARPRRVPLEELIRTIPGFDAVKTVAQLRMITGVVFLPSPPAGISLTNDLRAELGVRTRRAEESWRRPDRIVLTCPTCGQRLRIRLFLVGSAFRCPGCRTQYRSSFDLHGGVRLEKEPSREQRRARMRVTPEHRTRSPHDILGVPRTASATDIKRAYRKLMKANHPDVVGGEDPKARARAEEKTKEIIRAYHEVMEGMEEE
ncbi:MAG: J domain-containing protein [Verrucomicrobiota bacterium]